MCYVWQTFDPISSTNVTSNTKSTIVIKVSLNNMEVFLVLDSLIWTLTDQMNQMLGIQYDVNNTSTQ